MRKVITRIHAFYGAISVLIEKEAGLMAVPLIHLSSEGFGRVVITVGKLVVLDRALRDVHRFGFSSLENLQKEGGRYLQSALALIKEYHPVAVL